MNTEHLRYFITTVETGSYAEAARILFITPEGVSKAIKALEKDYGVPLFEKDGRNIRPTQNGLCFYRKAKQLADGLIDMREWSKKRQARHPTRRMSKRAVSLASFLSCKSPLREAQIAPFLFNSSSYFIVNHLSRIARLR